MFYVTQGTIQIHLATGTKPKKPADVEIKINPLKDYSITHNSRAFIVFVHDGKRLKARLFETTEAFLYRSDFVQSLIDVAAKGIKVEIQINDSQPPEIQSIKIPALQAVL